MKARLKYLTPGLLLVGVLALCWVLGAPASHLNTIVLAVGITVLMNFLFSAHQSAEKAHEEHRKSLDREITFYSYARRVFNAQTAVIARLQARLYRRDRS